MNTPNQVSQAVGEQGVFSRFTQAAFNTRLGRMLTATSVALTLGAGAETAGIGFDTAPAVAENTPTHAASANTTPANGSLEAECAKSILAQPDILKARLRKPNQVDQSIFIKLHFDAVQPPECNDHYLRKAFLRPQIQDIDHRNRWINEDGSRWAPVYGVGNQARVGGMYLLNSARQEKLYYKPGSGVKVRFKLKLEDRNKQTGDISHTKITNYPIEVQ